jgi:hypothetical protein
MGLKSALLAVSIHTNMASDGINPGKYGLTWSIRVPDAMNAQPSLLQKIRSLLPVSAMVQEVAKKGGADRRNENGRSNGVGLLIECHQTVQFSGGRLLSDITLTVVRIRHFAS